MSPEQLLEAFRRMQGEEAEIIAKAQAKEYLSSQEQTMVRQAAMADAQVMEMLQSLDMQKSPENILALQEMLTDRNRMFRTLFGEKNKSAELKEAIKEIKENIIKDFAEALSAPEEMAEAQEKLADIAEKVMENMVEDVEASSLDIQQLRRMRIQLDVIKMRSRREEYAIPVLVSDEFGTVSLKIVRGEREEGKVAITLETEHYGKLAASFRVQSNAIRGYVVSDNENGLQELKQADAVFKESLSRHTGLQMEVEEIAYVGSKELSLARFEGGFEDGAGFDMENKVQTQILYGIAKGFLITLQQISF